MRTNVVWKASGDGTDGVVRRPVHEHEVVTLPREEREACDGILPEVLDEDTPAHAREAQRGDERRAQEVVLRAWRPGDEDDVRPLGVGPAEADGPMSATPASIAAGASALILGRSGRRSAP